MDSFFAAADNLDHLLDELEEEEDTSSFNSAGTKSVKKNISSPSVSKVEDTHKFEDANKTSKPANHESVPANGIIEKSPISKSPLLNGAQDGASSLTSNQNDTIAPSLILIDSPHDPINSASFAIAPSGAVGTAPKSNSELLMDLFGATPAEAIDNGAQENAFKGPMSPLNPFLSDLIPSTPTVPLLTQEPQTHVNDVPSLSKESKDFSISEEDNSSRVVETSTIENQDMDSYNEVESTDRKETPYLLDPCSPEEGLPSSSQRDVHHSDQNENPELSNKVGGTDSSDQENRDSGSDGDMDSASFSQDVSVTEEELERFWNDFNNKSALQPVRKETGAIPKRNVARFGQNLPKTKKQSQVRENMPSEVRPENVADGPKDIVPHTFGNTNNKRIRIDEARSSVDSENTKLGSQSEDAAVPLAENSEFPQNNEIPIDESLLPEDVKISDHEFQRFLSQTENESTDNEAHKDNVPMETDSNSSVAGISPSPTSQPQIAVAEQNTERGQGNHPERVSDPESTPTSMSVDTAPETQVDADSRPLSLNIGDRSSEDSDSTCPYPVTPPPPYTEEMHTIYEQTHNLSRDQAARSSTDGQSSAGNQMPSDVPMNPPYQAEATEDDGFSFIPNSVLQSITRPGETKPEWVPDSDAPQCSNCANRFTFTRRRHHCRACGRVFCASCCNTKSPLQYLEFKEARVCTMCSLAIMQADALAEMSRRAALTHPPQASHPAPPASTPSAPPEFGAIPQPPTTTSPPVPPPENQEAPTEQELPDEATLHEIGTSQPQEIPVPSPKAEGPEGAAARTPGTKSVRFSDGTRPTHPDEMPSTPPPPSRMKRIRRKHGYNARDPNSPDGNELPPIIIAHGENGTYAVEENPDMNMVVSLLESGGPNPQSFVLNPNLLAHVRFLTYAGRQCWCFWTEGMDGVGQRDVVFLLEREGLGDRILPLDVFALFSCIFDRARKGKIFNNTDFMAMSVLGVEDNEEILGLKENAGFLFVHPTSQPLEGLSLPKKKDQSMSDSGPGQSSTLSLRSMLFVILVQRTEAPWATLFPMRLMLRLGMEMKQYPCPLFSVRRRQPVYHQLGHTILAILCDFRNFKYRVVSVPGLRIVAAENGSVSVQIPCNRFTDTVKIMNSSNESVLAIGTGTFGPSVTHRNETSVPLDSPCDSHLVCVQEPNSSNYHTEVMCMKNVQPTYTGAAFVIFNGSLKTDGTHQAKCAIVEDGIMVQLLPEKMEELRASLRSMDDFRLELAPTTPPTPTTEITPQLVQIEEVQPPVPPTIEIRWVDDDTAFNIGMFSPIDGTGFEGVVGFNVQGRSEQRGRKHTLRWNQVFFLASTSDPLDMSRLAEQVANGCFLALTPVLQELAKHRQHKVAVRVTIHPDNVGYVAGSRCRPLPPSCMNALDEHLIPTIHNAAVNVPAEQEAVVIELLFSILLLRPGYRTA